MILKAILLLSVIQLALTEDEEGVLLKWTPWSQCSEGRKERSRLQKITEVQNCCGQRWTFDDGGKTNFGDCEEIFNAGITKPAPYTIEIRPGVTAKVMCAADGWTVIQSRGQFGNPQDYFERDWKSYVEGFGVPGEEHWLGLENMFDLLLKKDYQLRVTMTDFNQTKKYSLYDKFYLENRKTFPIKIGAFSGDAGDSLQSHNGHEFSTNDHGPVTGCANKYHGGWWYHSCHHSQLNGLNFPDGVIPDKSQGITWNSFTKHRYSLMTSEMAIKSI